MSIYFLVAWNIATLAYIWWLMGRMKEMEAEIERMRLRQVDLSILNQIEQLAKHVKKLADKIERQEN